MTVNSKLSFRNAARDDLPEVVRLLADDPLGAKRERYEKLGFVASHEGMKLHLPG